MTKRIFRSIFSVSAVILVISIGLILGLLYGHFGKRLEKELKQEAAYLALAVEKDGEESLAKLSKTGERVTLIDSDERCFMTIRPILPLWRTIRTGRKYRRQKKQEKGMRPEPLQPWERKRSIMLSGWKTGRFFVYPVRNIRLQESWEE